MRCTTTLKFESRDEWLGIRDWGLGVTGDLIQPTGIIMIYTPRRFYIFMRRTTISHFSFLISHSNEAFKRNQGAARPGTNSEPTTLNPTTFIFFPFLYISGIIN